VASKKAVSAALAVLSRAFAGEVGREKLVVYHDALADVGDAELAAAAMAAVRTYAGPFIPPPAVLRDAAGANAPAVDVERVAAEVARLGVYNPNGWCLPSIRVVRERMGEAIAAAVADVGISRVCSSDERTQAIALQELRRALHAEAQRAPGTLPAWASGRKSLPADFGRAMVLGAGDA